MKNDINLFIKRKESKNTKKILVGLFFGAAFLVVFTAIGILLPMNNRAIAQSKLDGLNQQLQSLGFTEEDFIANSDKSAEISTQLNELSLLYASRSDILAYLAEIENALPTAAHITYMSLTGNQLQITGIAPGDTEIAALGLHMRESQHFNSVLVTVSTVSEEEGDTIFTLTAALPVSLSGEAIVEDGSTSGEETGNKTAEQTQEAVS